MKWILIVIILAGAFLLMIGSAAPADWALAMSLGALAALVARAAIPRSATARPHRMRLAGAPRFSAGVAIELISGAGTTLVALLRPGGPRIEHTARVSLAGRSEAARAVDGLVRSAAPGSVVILNDPGDEHMLVHAIEVASPEQIQRDADRFYQRYQKSFLS